MSSPSAPPGSPLEAEAIYEKAVRAKPGDAAAWHQLGLARQNLAKLDPAITAYRRALRIDDSLSEAHNDLGTAYYEKGWHREAEACFRKAIGLRPDHGIAHANLGAALRAQGRIADGRREYQRALGLKLRALLPAFLQWKIGTPAAVATARHAADASRVERTLNELSAVLMGGKREQARALAERAEKEFPNHPDILYLASLLREDLNEPEAALTRIDAAIGLKPDRAEYHVARARLLASLGRAEEALGAAQRGLQLEPGLAEAHAALAAVYRNLLRLDLAEQAARKAIELEPKSHFGHSNLSAALWILGRLDEAETHAREALRLAPRGVNYPLNLAVILKDAGKLDEARRIYREAIGKTPDHPGLLINLGSLAFQCEGDLDAAQRWYARCLSLGDDPRATLSDAVVDLLQSRFEQAWPKYEARKRVAGHLERHAPFAGIPAWNGERRAEGRLLVYGEQGLGDEITFSSMFADLGERAAQVTVFCDQRLRALFARSFPKFEFVAVPSGEKPDIGAAPDRAIAAGSLGMHFRRRAEDFPAHRGYLVADAAKLGDWHARLQALGPGRKIGISWAGGAINTGRVRRSLPLERLRPLLETPDTRWVSLQHGDTGAEVDAFTRSGGIRLQVFPGVTEDMDDLASLIGALDLVVSVCNTNVHVAGALGKDVLVMAPFLPEWRYGLRGERMLWYPSARVFRQATFGDWDSVIALVKEKISR